MGGNQYAGIGLIISIHFLSGIKVQSNKGKIKWRAYVSKEKRF